MTQRVQQQQDRWWWLMLIVALLALLGCEQPRTVNKNFASSIDTVTDPATGCQYLVNKRFDNYGSAITPRLHRRPNGRIEPMCGDTPTDKDQQP